MGDSATAIASHRTTTLAGAVGSLVEWYDFAIYGFFAASIGKLFFPAQAPGASLLAAFAVFAVGYAARPLGSLFFGYLGDRMGRRPFFLAIGIAGMVLTLIMIGITACLCLVQFALAS